MASARSNMIIKHYQGFGGNFIDSNYLGAAYDTGKPHEFMGTLTKIYSSQSDLFTGKLLTAQGINPGNVQMINSDVFRWTMQGAEERIAIVLENLEAGNDAPGLNNTRFRVKLDIDYYAQPDVLLGEDNSYPMAIIGDSVPDGTGYIYTLELQGDNPTVFCPPSLLEVGREFSKGWTSVQQEANPYFGTQQSPNLFKLESQIGEFAQKLTITDKAWREGGRLGVEFLYTDPHTQKMKKVNSFLPMAESRMYSEMYMSQEYQGWLGIKQTRPSQSGYWIKTGQIGPHIVVIQYCKFL